MVDLTISYNSSQSTIDSMRVLFNHVTKCGGSSFWKWLHENSDYHIEHVILQHQSSDSLRQILQTIEEQKNIIVGGHFEYSPGASVTAEEWISFWNKILSLTDYRFTIIRNPIKRFSSWLRFFGGMEDSNTSTAKSVYPDLLFQSNCADICQSLIEIGYNPKSSLTECLKSILPDNYLQFYPFNRGLVLGINNYPVALLGLSNDQSQYMLPVSLRHNYSEYEMNQISYNILRGDMRQVENYFSKALVFEPFPLENIGACFNRLASLGIVRSTFERELGRVNVSKKNDNFEIIEDQSVVSKIIKEYPESFLLWKIACLNAGNYESIH